MPINLTSYLNTAGLLETVPEDVLFSIREQSSAGGAQIQLGSAMVSIQPTSTGAFFTGEVNREGLSEGAFYTALSNLEYLESELNDGLSGRDVVMLERLSTIFINQSGPLLNRIEECSFDVMHAALRGTEESKTCPVTLCEPETGVFMKNSLSSDVCSLYEKGALVQLVKTASPHPLSRENIDVSMIVPREPCYFDPQSGNFRYFNGEMTYL
ncbi:T3SS effector NleG family protein [Escherichia coli]|uniref:T3SS effector NleG family protein n=1 Tax=Escherichia coli TaxID=562 RepID=UPI0019186B72|nr:T3SS effector NleG family protein [Escherichia coli]CAD5509474.1 T3SS secreted effector NleG-like protein [Escherichia coli]